ncbi:MAG: hypothetical protein JOZ41_03215 [Chloroflexi bacterium]|nr:hypothetical protein [Chloroflexota bacterium]
MAHILVGLSGRGIIVWAYLHALLDPVHNISFIYGTAFIIFILEFFNIFFTLFGIGMVSVPIWAQICVFAFVAPFPIIVLLLFKQKAAILYFVASLVARIAFRSVQDDDIENHVRWALFVGLLVVGIAVPVLLAQGLWSALIPFPQIVYDGRPWGDPGAWRPQGILLWGILFFGLLGVFEALRILAPAPAARLPATEGHSPDRSDAKRKRRGKRSGHRHR